ncbi:alpha/beta hydrolase [Arenibaculum sp.]|jgi:pimeloyl-ACP methyl ester carboxylesterase|uniref:alpha/beta fold hydrolase n=1 Tax=Arenibaculum sp. TaxID=2865862 RepID=UPI002E13E560|nr:alpha/beta hydrolase [Arenibaculum sp.]
MPADPTPAAAVRFEAGGGTLVAETHRPASGDDRLHLVWLHGWGQPRASMASLARSFEAAATNHLLDMPGFGEAPPPPSDWGTEQYGDLLAQWLRQLRGEASRRVVLVGHSFGGRVALRVAARHPGLADAIVLVAGAGLKRHRPLPRRLKAHATRLLLRAATRLDAVAGTGFAAGMRDRLGSEDYRRAGVLRPVLVRTVTEDLATIAPSVRAPVLLVYGERDDQTPPEFGRRYAELIPGAELAILPNFDHYTILSSGRHQVHMRMQQFLERHLPARGPATGTRT